MPLIALAPLWGLFALCCALLGFAVAQVYVVFDYTAQLIADPARFQQALDAGYITASAGSGAGEAQ